MPYIGQQPTNVAFLTDQFSGNGSTTAFTLSAAPANTSSILVAISGVLQDPSTYSVSGTTLTFSPAPPTGTGNISVRFLGIPASGVTTTAYRTVTEFTATSGQTTFSVPSYTVGFIDVYRNGVLLGSADYTATSGVSVVLVNGCTVGDLVEVISFQVSSVLNAVQATGATFSGNVLFASGNGIWNTSGNVGIGTASPARNLTLTSSGNTTLQVTNSTSGTASADGFIAQQNGLNTFLLNQEAGSLHLGTSNIERISIDSAGRVTMPFQPLMYARAAGASFATAATPLILTTNLINIGSNFNTSNGRFTAPIAGNYLVIYTTLKQGSGGADYQIRLNGSPFIWAYGGGDATTASTHAIIQLATNDYIDFSSGGNYYTNYTAYSVQLVS